MSRTDQLTVVFVDVIPSELAPGKLYVSRKYNTAVHSCCCGCGYRVTTPTTSTGWGLTLNGEAPTLSNSIGNGSFPCKSHYLVRNGHIKWLPKITADETAHDRARDLREVATAVQAPSRFTRITNWLRQMFRA